MKQWCNTADDHGLAHVSFKVPSANEQERLNLLFGNLPLPPPQQKIQHSNLTKG